MIATKIYNHLRDDLVDAHRNRVKGYIIEQVAKHLQNWRAGAIEEQEYKDLLSSIKHSLKKMPYILKEK